MRSRMSNTRRVIACVLCTAFMLSLLPATAAAGDGPRIIIEIGQPSVWSLGQAHYLLAKMHRRDRKLSTRFPEEGDLDPNKISATRIEALRSSLGVEGQFDQGMGVTNDLAMKRYNESEARRGSARTEVSARQVELQQVNSELAELNEQIALAEEEDRQSTEARARTTPSEPPTAQDNERKKQIVLMRVRKTRKEEQRTDLKSQITALSATADAPSTTPTFQQPALTSGAGSLPNPDAFKAFMDKAVQEAGKPDLSASMKLDNFVAMQYEIIAKQLTLLRDEVGPDDRVVFFELPASIYTVDKKADDYVAQVEWQVTTYYDTEPSIEVQAEVIENTLRNEGKSEEEILTTLLKIDKVKDARRIQEFRQRLTPVKRRQLREGIERRESTSVSARLSERAVAAIVDRRMMDFERSLNNIYTNSHSAYPITLEMIKLAAQRRDISAKDAVETAVGESKKLNVRTIDIIPRQSALNVNEAHATVKQTMILAAFKFLVGFAGQVNYQRQRELYEQFVQQQIFASGYGKGADKFGWTYGPQPGTKRIAPGQRTTFAVVVVPRNTLAVELNAKSRYYKRDKSPVELGQAHHVTTSADTRFLLSIPGKRTQEFWVDGISYAPVKKGRRVTVLIEGNYFSPQLGIMVNGVPLEPVLSISRIAGSDEEVDVQSADGVTGEYEVTNSRQIVLSFLMGDSYVGTPTITFTSPEKSTPINFFDLKVNYGDDLISLQDRSVREPMFIEDFNDKLEIEPIKDIPVVTSNGDPADFNGRAVAEDEQASFKLVRLKGSGLRPKAGIMVNDTPVAYRADLDSLKEILEEVTDQPSPRIPFVTQDSTKNYFLYFPNTKGKWKVGYRHQTRQSYEEAVATKDFSPPPPFKTEVKGYRYLEGSRGAEVDLNISSKKLRLVRVIVEDPSNGRCRAAKQIDDHLYRVKCFVPAVGRVERNTILIRSVLEDANGIRTEVFSDVELPVRPILLSLYNPRTGRASGFPTEQPLVVISGANLSGVTSVLFGTEKGEITGVNADSITVKVPLRAAIARGEAVSVPVVLQTAAGPIPTGGMFTYLGEPSAAEIVLWPGRRPRRRSRE